MKRILLIEDNHFIRENITEMLELAGYEVTATSDGFRGIELAKTRNHDIILCDVMMPGASGHDVFKELKKEQLLDSVPFVFISASVEKKEVQAALDMGVTGYIRKPFEEKDLLEVISKHTSGH